MGEDIGSDDCDRDEETFLDTDEALFEGDDESEQRSRSVKDLRGIHTRDNDKSTQATNHLREERQRELAETKANLEKWRGIVDTDESVEERMAILRGHSGKMDTGENEAAPTDSKKMRGFIESDTNATSRLRNARWGQPEANGDDDTDSGSNNEHNGRETPTKTRSNPADTAGNWPGIDEAIREKRKAQRPTQLFIGTGTVEDPEARLVARGKHVRLTHVAQDTEQAALEAFYERCETHSYEVIEEPTVQQISLEELLELVNDPETNLGAGVVPDGSLF